MQEPRIGDYALCKHMRISDNELNDTDEETVLFWKIMMRREFKHQDKMNREA